MKKTLLLTLLLISVLLIESASAVEVTNFNGTFVRGSGAPFAETITFPGVEGVAILRISNAAEDDSTEKVSSSIIKINGIDIFTQDGLNQNVSYLEKEIQLNEGNNFITVEIRGKPGGTIKADIIQSIDADGAGVIGQNGGEIITQDNSKILIPPDALSENKIISIKTSTENIIIDNKVTIGNLEFSPSGIQFQKPVICVMSLSKPLNPGQIVNIHLGIENNQKLLAYYYDDGTKAFGVVLDDGFHVSFLTDHFSSYFASELIDEEDFYQEKTILVGENNNIPIKFFIPRNEGVETSLHGTLSLFGLGYLPGLDDDIFRQEFRG